LGPERQSVLGAIIGDVIGWDFSAPEKTESLSMPPDERVGPDHHQGVGPIEPEGQRGHDPAGGVISAVGLRARGPRPVFKGESRLLLRLLEDMEVA
jgi:hypothetical protein